VETIADLKELRILYHLRSEGIKKHKNFLFSNTPRGAKASAIIYSIVETAKENGLNPYSYLAYIFKNAPNWDIHNDMEALQRLLPSFASSYCKINAVAD